MPDQPEPTTADDEQPQPQPDDIAVEEPSPELLEQLEQESDDQ